MSTGEEERGEAPGKFFKATPFTLPINVTDALFGTTVVLERNEDLANFMSYKRNSLRPSSYSAL